MATITITLKNINNIDNFQEVKNVNNNDSKITLLSLRVTVNYNDTVKLINITR